MSTLSIKQRAQPRADMPDIDRYTAWRIGCSPRVLGSSGTHVVPALPGRHPQLLEPLAATHPDVICIFERPGVSILRVHRSPSRAVESLLGRVPADSAAGPDQIVALARGPVHRHLREPYLYVSEVNVRRVSTRAARQLLPSDANALNELHGAIDPQQRWYVEIDHPVVFGLFSDDRLVSAASHFLFQDFHVAAAGVLTHPEYRRRGFGTAVVSAAVAWALERRFAVEWSTSESNLGSLGIARRLGFEPYASETEIRIGEAGSGAA